MELVKNNKVILAVVAALAAALAAFVSTFEKENAEDTKAEETVAVPAEAPVVTETPAAADVAATPADPNAPAAQAADAPAVTTTEAAPAAAVTATTGK